MFSESRQAREQQPPELRKFIYRDNFAGAKVVFECEAASISEADKMYLAKTGKNVEKQAHIGCSIEKIVKPTNDSVSE